MNFDRVRYTHPISSPTHSIELVLIVTIRLPFAKLTTWQQNVFAAAILERMLPNYQMFSEATHFGDSALLKNQLSLVWQRAAKAKSAKLNADAQLEKLEPNIPEPNEFEFFGVFPALDTVMGLAALLQFQQDKEVENIEQVSRLSENSVMAYVELLIAEELEEEVELEDLTPQIKKHPLYEWEKATQNELFDLLKNSPENETTIKEAKALVLSEGVSNLGVEIS